MAAAERGSVWMAYHKWACVGVSGGHGAVQRFHVMMVGSYDHVKMRRLLFKGTVAGRQSTIIPIWRHDGGHCACGAPPLWSV